MMRPERNIMDVRDRMRTDAGTAYRVWRADPSSNWCPICEALDGTRVPVGQAFPIGPNTSIAAPPVHPGCQCRIEIVDDRSPYESYELTTEEDNPDYESYSTTRSDARTWPLHPAIRVNAEDTAAMNAAIARNDLAEATVIGKRAGYRGGCRCAECSAAHQHAQRVTQEFTAILDRLDGRADDNEDASYQAMTRNLRDAHRSYSK